MAYLAVIIQGKKKIVLIGRNLRLFHPDSIHSYKFAVLSMCSRHVTTRN